MIVKNKSVVISQRRSVTTFFNRTLENFERKFDGFPAILLGANQTPAVNEDSDDYSGFLDQDIIDEIAQSIQNGAAPPCPDVAGIECIDAPELCEGGTTFGTLTLEDGEYVTEFPKGHIIDVYFDGMLAVRDIDYSETADGIVTLEVLEIGVIVTARYTIGRVVA